MTATDHGTNADHGTNPPAAPWPQVPPNIAVKLKFRCGVCGYAMCFASPKRGGAPTDFATMSGEFLARHAACNAHH